MRDEFAQNKDPIIWTLQQGLDLVRTIQPRLHHMGYHVAIGGGVINKGYSTKDLDLYFFPLDLKDQESLVPFLESLFGAAVPISMFDERYSDNRVFAQRLKFLQYDGGRIDIFITEAR